MTKTILVTGGAGHIGSHVIEKLLNYSQYKIISLDNYFTGSPDNHLKGADYRRGHTKDIDKLIPETPEIVFHLGEYARVAPSLDEPEKVYDMNVLGTFAVVEFCRRRKVGKLVYAASSTKFASNGQERHANPYSFTKANNVDLINNYGKWYQLPYAICYFYNAFGPRENGVGKYATLIAKFEQAYLKHQKLPIIKPGTQKRNFTYVGDLAAGMILAAQKGSGDGYALNNPKAYSVIEIAQAFDSPVEYINGYPGRTESGDSPTKANQLGWKTTIDVIDYIKDFIKNNPQSKS